MKISSATICALLLSINLSGAAAADLAVQVSAHSEGELEDAVVYARPRSSSGASLAAVESVVDQRDKEFIPYVLPVQAGTAVFFPNSDDIRHHVYSFSKAKQFEIPLYTGTPQDPIRFDKPGPVSLGCNIHDWMSGHIFVTDTPYFALTDASGAANIGNLPDGEYDVGVWHPRITKWQPQDATPIKVSAGGATLNMKVTLKKKWRAFRAPANTLSGYR